MAKSELGSRQLDSSSTFLIPLVPLKTIQEHRLIKSHSVNTLVKSVNTKSYGKGGRLS